VDGGLPSPHAKDPRAKGKFWGAAKFAFRPMTRKYQKCLKEQILVKKTCCYGKIISVYYLVITTKIILLKL
jgi:hypothetical protein